MHHFSEGDFITPDGIRIPHKHELVVHSDGDVLLRVLSDTLLGAVALGDIDKHFPDTDPRFKGAGSHALLRHMIAIITEKDWKAGNVDATIAAQALEVAPHIETMCGPIAEDLGVAVGQINVKTTATERLGFTGREGGIAVHAVALLIAR